MCVFARMRVCVCVRTCVHTCVCTSWQTCCVKESQCIWLPSDHYCHCIVVKNLHHKSYGVDMHNAQCCGVCVYVRV